MSLPPMSFPQSADELLRHAAWVRRVARALVRGADRVDDLEQETWLAALSHPPRHAGDKRSWLGAVTRNVAKHLFRSEATRERHERDPAHSRAGEGLGGISVASPAAGEIVARAEIQQRVAAAVLALEEPYKSTLLARYFDELPPTEIARALDVSVETVKTRLKRGLAQLRERLDSLKGDASTLEAALTPLCVPVAQVAVSASAKLIAAAATIVIGVSLVVMMNRRPAVSRANAASAAVPAVVASPIAPPTAPAVPIAASGDPAPQESGAPARTKESATVPGSPPDDAPAHMTGRLLLPDGSGAANVALRLYGWEGNQERALKYGLPTDWKPIDAVSQPDGSFALEFSAPRAFQFTFDAKLAGYAAPAWRWGEIAPGSTKALGDVTLQRAGTIRGRIVDKKGDSILQAGWTVHADGPKCAEGDGADETRVYSVVDATTASFLLENVPPGKIQLKANSQLTNWIEGPVVDVRSGETTEADIVYSGPDVAHRITVVLFARPFYIFESDAAEILLTGNGIEPRHATKIPFSSQSHSFNDLPDGQYTVEIRDPKFLPWRKDGVAVGSSISAKLKGNAQIRLHVVDAATGAEIPRYGLRVRFEFGPDVQMQPDTFELLQQGAEPPSDGGYDALVPVSQVFLVSAPGYAESSLPQRPLPANTTTEFTARLTKGATLSGRVVRADGVTPCTGVLVHLEPSRSGVDRFLHQTPEQTALLGAQDTTSDADGRFSFRGVVAGRFTVRNDDDNPALVSRIDNLDIGEDTTQVDDLKLVLPPRGFLKGRLLVPEGAVCAGFDIDAVPAEEALDDRLGREVRWAKRLMNAAESGNAPTSAGLRADGTFRIGPLPPGPKRLVLRYPAARVPISVSGYMSSGTGVEIEIPRVTDSGADRQDSVASTEFATIVDGEETLADFDARSAFAGRLRATVLIDGAALQNLIIEVIPSTGAFDPQAAIPRVERVAASRIGEDGVATFSAIPPGKVRLYVYPAEYSKSAGAGNPSWNWLSPEVFEIRPGEETNLSLSIAIVKGEVLILDESGAPVVSHWFELGFDQESLDRQIMTVMTDPAGKLALRLAPGNYRIRGIDAKSRKVTPATFEWTQYGPAVGSLRVVIRK